MNERQRQWVENLLNDFKKSEKELVNMIKEDSKNIER